MKKRVLVISVASIFLFAISVVLPMMTACESEAAEPGKVSKVFKWRAQNTLPRFEHDRARNDWVADLIREKSGGRLDIRWYAGGELIPAKETFDAVRRGTIEMAYDMAGYHIGFMPEAAILFMLPGSFRSSSDVHHFAYSRDWMFFEKVQAAYAKQGVYVIDFDLPGQNYVLMLTKPIKRLDDLGKLKIRSYGTLAKWLAKTKAGMVFFPAGEIYTGLQMGTVDAATWVTYAKNYALKLHEVAKFAWEMPGTTTITPALIYVNKKAWDALPDDLKLMFQYYNHLYRTTWLMHLDEVENQLSKERMINQWGVTIIELPKEDINRWLAMGHELWGEMAAANATSAEWIEYIKKWMTWRGYSK